MGINPYRANATKAIEVIMPRDFDLIKENSPTVQDKLTELTAEVRGLRQSIEDLNALVLGAVTKQKVNKL